MVLAALGRGISQALRKMGSSTVVDEDALDACLKEVRARPPKPPRAWPLSPGGSRGGG